MHPNGFGFACALRLTLKTAAVTTVRTLVDKMHATRCLVVQRDSILEKERTYDNLARTECSRARNSEGSRCRPPTCRWYIRWSTFSSPCWLTRNAYFYWTISIRSMMECFRDCIATAHACNFVSDVQKGHLLRTSLRTKSGILMK